jgi:DNA (cytosine-5)-methyltransferase 1
MQNITKLTAVERKCDREGLADLANSLNTDVRVVDLFCGAGGLSLGFQRAGYEAVAAFDNWEPAMNIYRKNFTHPSIHLDLSDEAAFHTIAGFKPEMIIGGPPCQDFSSAGQRNDSGHRADLTISFTKIVAKIQPKYFLMENVAGILRSKRLIEARILLADYGLSQAVLNASYCDVPQARKRFFLFGELGGAGNGLEPYLTGGQSPQRMTVRDYFGDTLGTEYYYCHPRFPGRRAVYGLDEPSPTIRGTNRPIPKTYKPHPNDASSITGGVRVLTSLERAQVQTFPKEFIWAGTKTDVEQAIGNAVPVNLARFVADCIRMYISRKTTFSSLFGDEPVAA